MKQGLVEVQSTVCYKSAQTVAVVPLIALISFRRCQNQYVDVDSSSASID